MRINNKQLSLADKYKTQEVNSKNLKVILLLFSEHNLNFYSLLKHTDLIKFSINSSLKEISEKKSKDSFNNNTNTLNDKKDELYEEFYNKCNNSTKNINNKTGPINNSSYINTSNYFKENKEGEVIIKSFYFKKSCFPVFSRKSMIIEKSNNFFQVKSFNKDTFIQSSNNEPIKKDISFSNIKCLFSGCKSLVSISDISNWDISRCSTISSLFKECSSLVFLSDISNWNTNNIKDVSYIFSGCSSLKSLPDISKWNVSKVENMQGMFNECSSLSSLPDISKWNIKNTKDISYMFRECFSLESLPDISKWETNNIENIMFLFSN